ncbi:fibrinolysis [Pristimantis euphronides]
MNFLLHFGLFSLIAVDKVFSQTSCFSEKNLSKNKEETSCINLGLSILPLTDIPKNTAILILSFNNFKSLSTSSFKGFKDLTELEVPDNGMTSFEIDLPLNLEELNLANNTLKKLPEVSQLSSLITLQLSNNRISTLPENSFKGLKKMTRLELQHNRIDTLNEEVFDDLVSLIYLDLSYNQLWLLPDHLLSNTPYLEILYLSGNRLTHIPDDFFRDLELSFAYLDKNPWICNCALQYFKTWLEEKDQVHEFTKDGPTKNQKIVVCTNGTPLIDYNTDHCSKSGKGDRDINSGPIQTKMSVQTEAMTTPLWTTTLLVTTVFLKTEKQTPPLRTTIRWPTSTIEATTVLPITTTKKKTTIKATTIFSTTSTTQRSTMLESTRTTESLKTSPRATIRSTTTSYPTTLKMMTTTKEQSTTLHSVPTMDTVSTSMVSTSDRVEISTMVPTDEYSENPITTMLQTRSSRAAAVGIDWLLKVILEHCCLLHVIIYGLCIVLVLLEIIITTIGLLWIYCCNQELLQWLPRIRLIRYSMRVPTSDEEILLVNNGAVESHFREQSLAGVTKMLVLESNTQEHDITYTSGIL